jgi:hypothetical protein
VRFEVIPGEAHQPFQEVPDQWNAASTPSGGRSRHGAEGSTES